MDESLSPRPDSRARRILQYPATHLLIAMVWLGGLLIALVALKMKPGLVFEVTGACVIAAAYIVYVRVVERRPVTELGPNGAAAEFGAGFLVGAALFSLTIGIIWALGDYTITGVNSWTAILSPLGMGLAAGVLEEIMFRGGVFRITEEWLGSWGALAVSSLLFGAAHLANPHATIMSAISIALEAGVLLGAAFMVTRRLWLPIGLHAAWNFTQAGIFGAPVSGTTPHGLFVSRLSGPGWATGGGFGPEASLPAVLVALSSVWVLVYVVRSGGIVPPIWVRRAHEASALPA